jgi:tetratricopeptide (TPR) repeat protein
MSTPISTRRRWHSSLLISLFGDRIFCGGQQILCDARIWQAIGPYQEALELEKKDQKLDRTKWRVLTDNLAMAYGITGKLTTALEVVNYGMSKDPAYPMFYYIAADSYAERNDFDNTMKYLRLALAHKSGVTPGETLPDPNEDDSFARFLKNDEFRKLAAQFK